MRARFPRIRTLTRILAVFLVVLLVWLATCIQVVARTPGAAPRHVDVLVVTGPAVSSTLEEAQKLVDDNGIEHVLLSVPYKGSHEERDSAGIARWCSGEAVHADVTCFVPNPYTTAGEIQELAHWQHAHDARSVGILTANTRVSRARLLASRCFPEGTVTVFSVDHSPQTALGWLPKFAYETGAFGKAAFVSTCP